MKTLTSAVSTQAAALQSGWCELYDFYLPSAIATPFGTVATLRLTTLPNGIQFFTPKVSPEPSGTQGTAQAYLFWPLKREVITGSAKFANDKLQITASNVTGDWANMLAEVDWDSVTVTIRKVATTVASPTADDCTVIFSGGIDSVSGSLETLQFGCSSDLGTFQLTAPRENMHANCRFNWADNLCTKLRFGAANYKTKTVGTGSTVSDVVSGGLTEDTGSKSGYGSDLVAALADANITASSTASAFSGSPVTWQKVNPRVTDYRMKLAPGMVLAYQQSFTLATTGTMPSPLTAGTTYYVVDISGSFYQLSATPSGTPITVLSTGSNVTLTTLNFSAAKVKAGSASYWAIPDDTDWGTLTQGYWQIPDAQAGLANFTLKPYIQFDFGSAVTPALWQLMGVNTGDRQDLPRLVLFFSSTNNTTWKFETYFELPPLLGATCDVLIPNAQTARYWRICVRTRWSTDVRFPMFNTISAFAGSRNYWQNGIITFSSSTATAALQGVSRAILESYSGELICAPFPVAPVSGDTFTIERGCARTFNACAARGNTENFGGFNTLPFVQITVNP